MQRSDIRWLALADGPLKGWTVSETRGVVSNQWIKSILGTNELSQSKRIAARYVCGRENIPALNAPRRNGPSRAADFRANRSTSLIGSPLSSWKSRVSFRYPTDARWNSDLAAVEFGIGVGEYEGIVRVPRQVFQALLDHRPTPERCLEAHYVYRTRLELIA